MTVRGERRWVLVHRCTHCGRLRLNRTAADDNVLLLMQLAALPLALPPIPYAAPVPDGGHDAGPDGDHNGGHRQHEDGWRYDGERRRDREAAEP